MSGKTAKQNRELERHHRIFWGSSYDRGLDILLFMWPQILEKFPDATLHTAYGWELFDMATRGNPERQQWKASVQNMMRQKNIYHYGRLGKDQLKEVRAKCGIWAYPTYFPEIDCITAKDCQKDGLVPVTMTYAALSETVKAGVKIDGEIKSLEVQEKFIQALLDMLGDSKKWLTESKKAKEAMKDETWEKSANEWLKEFTPAPTPLVSVCTITIREGFWNIMAQNLSKQTYKNFEWVIIDDYPTDRRLIAEKYARKYNLNISYHRGDKVTGYYRHPYGLVKANNKSWKVAKGELMVYIQDFILIPEDGIEKLVDLHNRFPRALIAPVDEYFYTKDPDKTNKEDWWNGDLDIINKFSWRNVRLEFAGIRKTENPFDFEMNYSAIPKKFLEEVNGWWEFFDQGLGYDNTEIAYRALQSGYDIIIDDTNVAKCINLWPFIAGQPENILNRERQLNPPRYKWFMKQMEQGKLPLVRDVKLDESISLPFEVPKDLPDEKCSDWITEHTQEILAIWDSETYQDGDKKYCKDKECPLYVNGSTHLVSVKGCRYG